MKKSTRLVSLDKSSHGNAKGGVIGGYLFFGSHSISHFDDVAFAKLEVPFEGCLFVHVFLSIYVPFVSHNS